MQPPLASRRDQPVGDQHLQHLVPARALAAFRQALGPEAIELKLAPQDAGEPAGAPLARPAQPHLGEPQPDHVVAFGAPRSDPPGTARASATVRVLVEDFDRPAPSLGLGRVDLAEVEHVALHHAAAIEPPVLDDAPVKMRLPVLSPFGLSQKHGGKDCATALHSGNPWRA